MPEETTFLKSSKSVVKAFLSSVVLVDDGAYLVPYLEDPPPKKLVAPGRQGAVPAVDPEIPAKETPVSTVTPVSAVGIHAKTVVAVEKSAHSAEPVPASPPSRRDRTLDGKMVIDVFAQIGVVCAVMRPAIEELPGLSDLIMTVGENADAVILDWVLFDSQGGERTLELIERIVDSSVAESGRARLIVVYTAEPNLIDIERDIRKRLKLEEEIPANTLTIMCGGTRICIYGKSGIRPARIGDDRLKAPSELADVVISEFTEMTKGLLSNVAMKSITAVRAKTFQLLRRFDCTVDAPYVTHSTLISPEHAEEQVTALIVSEIQEILEDENVGSLADYAHIIEWLDDQMANGLALPTSADLTSDQYYAGLVQLIKNGIREPAVKKLRSEHAVFADKIIPKKKENGKEKEPAKYLREALTGILRSKPSAPHHADEVLAMLMSLRHRYTNPAPQLALGTIVARTDDAGTTYLLCLQPVCDSVRLKGPRRFAFLSLKPADNSRNCELIVSEGEQLVFLALKPNPYLLEMISFSPNRDEKVMADVRNGDFLFTSDDNVAFRWIADLKPPHAQRIAMSRSRQFGQFFGVSKWKNYSRLRRGGGNVEIAF